MGFIWDMWQFPVDIPESAPNSLDLSLHLLHPLSRMLTFGVLRPLWLSRHWIHFFGTHFSPKSSNSPFTHKLCRLFSSMDRNLKYTPLLKLPGSTAYTTRHSDRFLKSRVPTSTELYRRLIPLAPMNFYSPCHILFFLLAFHPPTVSLIQD